MQNESNPQPPLVPTGQPQTTPPEPPVQIESASSPQQPQQPVQAKVRWYKSTLFIALLLVFIPPVGLILMWLLAPWKKYVKGLVTVPVVITSAVFLLMFANLVQSVVGQVGVLKDEPARMEQFLKEKYGKDFVVKNGKIENGGDALFGVKFKTYKATVSPTDDTNMEFTASRIVEGESLDGGENSPDKQNYSDDYILRLWTAELQDKVNNAISTQPVDVFSVDFHVGLTKNRASIAAFYDKIWGTTPTYDELTLELKQELTLASSPKALGPMTAENVEAYAATMIAIRDALDPNRQGLGVQVNEFGVYDKEEGGKELGKWQNLAFVKLVEVESIDELTPYFVKWTDGYGKYYNPETREFDVNHPN
jgi:hypothetical protein